MSFKQEPHKLLVIPGPIEVADDVLYANAHYSVSHMAPDFAATFKESLHMLRELLYTASAQPFIISGSGTLGWDQVSANLLEPSDDVLVLNSGYFGDSFAECLEAYGANVTSIYAGLGEAVKLRELEEALKTKKFKAITITHVDTSTGVLSPIKEIATTVQKVSPETLIIVDGVCSVASEEIRFDDWGIDVVMSASQKGIGIPPGLSLLMVSQRAMQVFSQRKSPVAAYYASWKKWLPIMQAYDRGAAAYFATPPTNLIYALHASLSTIIKGAVSLQDRFAAHRDASKLIRAEVAKLGLKIVPTDEAYAANTMTAVYFPDGVTAADIVPQLLKHNIVVAGGLHKEVKDKYFRIGHMGITVVDRQRGDIEKIIDGVKAVVVAATSKL